MRYVTLAGLLCGAGALWTVSGGTYAQDREPLIQQERQAIQIEERVQPRIQERRGVRIQGEVEGRVQPRPDIAVEGDVQGVEFYRASEIIGLTVRDAENQPLGRVKDLMIDGRTEEVRYLILDGGDALQAQAQLFVLPWAVVEPNLVAEVPAQRFIAVDFPRQQLLRAPTITEAQFRTAPVAVFDRVDQFFQVDTIRGRRTLRPGIDGTFEGELQPGETRPGVSPRRQPGVQTDDGVEPRPQQTPGTRPRLQPGARPGGQPGARPGVQPGTQPGGQPGVRPRTQPGREPGAQPGGRPRTQPGTQPATPADPADPATPAEPGTQPATPATPATPAQPGTQPDAQPETQPGTQPNQEGGAADSDDN